MKRKGFHNQQDILYEYDISDGCLLIEESLNGIILLIIGEQIYLHI